MTTSTLSDSMRRLRLLGLVAAGLLLTGCAGKSIVHGHVLAQEEIEQVTPGMSKDQVQLLLGSPDTTSAINGETFYYISSTASGPAFLKPTTVDRRIVAVYFTPAGSVTKVAHYGLKDGRVFDFISRTTPSHTGEQTLLAQLLGNLGLKKGF
jgi:outer membrane protein assembly factor BamE (lipoprotein component of BamABCDE complex)